MPVDDRLTFDPSAMGVDWREPSFDRVGRHSAHVRDEVLVVQAGQAGIIIARCRLSRLSIRVTMAL
jgi:hypothetical protein